MPDDEHPIPPIPSPNGRRLRPLILAILPLAFLAAERILRAHGLPYWLWFNLDPSYLYFLNGLHVLDGATPGHVDHPGTPVQVLMALVIRLSGLAAPGTIGDGAFAWAEILLMQANTVLLVLTALAMGLLGAVVARRSGRLVVALLAQMTPFLSMLALKHGIHVKPEPMLLLAVLLLSAAMVEQAIRPRWWLLLALGAVCGFGIAVKITFAPIALAPFLLARGMRARALFCLAMVLALALFLWPAWGALDRMAEWIVQLATHGGAYGNGAPSVMDLERYPAAFFKLFFARPVFLAVYAASLAVLVLGWRRRRRRGGAPMDGVERALLGVLVAQLAQMLMVAKHPSAHYVLPALELSGLSMALLWLAVRRVTLSAPRRRLVQGAFAGLLVLLLVLQSVAFLRQDREMRADQAGALSIDMARDFPGCAIVYLNMASSPANAWFYNHAYGSHRYGARLKALMPTNEYFAYSWRSGVENWDGPVSPATLIARYPCVALRSTDAGYLRTVAGWFGTFFDKAASCAAGGESILVAGASCPAG